MDDIFGVYSTARTRVLFSSHIHKLFIDMVFFRLVFSMSNADLSHNHITLNYVELLTLIKATCSCTQNFRANKQFVVFFLVFSLVYIRTIHLIDFEINISPKSQEITTNLL